MIRGIEVQDGGEGVVVTLETGEGIRIMFQDVLGVEGYHLKVIAPKEIRIIPEANNSLRITTPNAERRLAELVDAAVAQRKSEDSPFRNKK